MLSQCTQTAHCKSARQGGWEVETNFLVDDPAGKGVQCACHMQACKHHGDMQQSRNENCSTSYISVRCSPVVHCSIAALPLPLLKYPFLAIFLLPHIWGEGHVDERRDFKKDCFEQNFLCFAFISPSHFFQLSKITSGLAENNDTRPKWQKKR